MLGAPNICHTTQIASCDPVTAGVRVNGGRTAGGARRRLGEGGANVGPMLSYLDPGTGSMIVAAFAGGAAGFAVLLKMYWHRFLGVFSKKHRARAEEAQAQLLPDDRRRRRRPHLTPPRRDASVTARRADPGSFRDPLSRVFVGDDGVWRGLSKEALADYEVLAASRFFRDALARGDIVGTQRVEDDSVPGDWAARPAPRPHRRALLPVRVALRDAARRRPPAARPHPRPPSPTS